jgi:TusA-related sulfurtransferase
MTNLNPDRTLDAIDLMCPMPLVKARQELMKLDIGGILKVIATDKGSVRDFQGWSRTAKNMELLEQSEDQLDDKKVFVHFVKRTK